MRDPAWILGIGYLDLFGWEGFSESLSTGRTAAMEVNQFDMELGDALKRHFGYDEFRPLLAVCSGILEDLDAALLEFFEMGPDGKIQKISHSILPGGDLKLNAELEYEKDGWQFYLPRKGRTIVVRSERTKKTLHKFTWNGEKFQEDK